MQLRTFQKYLTDFPDTYEGDLRKKIELVVGVMDMCRAELDERQSADSRDK